MAESFIFPLSFRVNIRGGLPYTELSKSIVCLVVVYTGSLMMLLGYSIIEEENLLSEEKKNPTSKKSLIKRIWQSNTNRKT